jgi:hypothetical protein
VKIPAAFTGHVQRFIFSTLYRNTTGYEMFQILCLKNAHPHNTALCRAPNETHYFKMLRDTTINNQRTDKAAAAAAAA